MFRWLKVKYACEDKRKEVNEGEVMLVGFFSLFPSHYNYNKMKQTIQEIIERK